MLSILGPGAVQGTLPAELDRLTAAQLVDFTGQHFTGALPASWGADGGFASLEMLSLGQNQLESSLPAEWGSQDRCAAASGWPPHSRRQGLLAGTCLLGRLHGRSSAFCYHHLVKHLRLLVSCAKWCTTLTEHAR